ncbi:hypothetical protein ACIQOU_32940 [Streptomyces sp. NPDC091279]|uniref:hypothetical protein n=1 Tax=Streptomyces sp. NPDC091279 TaxID=3365983 RepID=UPI0038182C3B
MPAVVANIEHRVVFLARPTGLEWHVPWTRIRPATEWEKHQLVALGQLHAQRQKGA